MAFAPLSMSMACASPHPSSGSSDCPAGLQCPTAGVTQIASDSYVSAELAVTSSALYWVDRGESIADSIRTAPTGGGTPTVFYTAPDTTIAIEAIAVDDHNVYWTEVSSSSGAYASTLKAMPLGHDGPPQVLASNPPAGVAFFNLAVDATHAYFSVSSTELAGNRGGIERVPIAGGPVEVVATTDPSVESIGFVTANATGVYWIEQSSNGSTVTRSLMRLAPGVAQPSTLDSASFRLDGSTAPVGPSGPIAVNGDTVVWIGSDGSVNSMPAAGGSARVLLAGGANATLLAASASDVFVVEIGPGASGVMQRVPLDGSPATTIASGMGLAGGYSAYQGIVTDATSVYWAGGSGVFSAAQ
jgi:hypothetical protein